MDNLITKARSFMEYIQSLKALASLVTGDPVDEIKINDEAALEYFNDGYTPEQCFREVWEGDND